MAAATGTRLALWMNGERVGTWSRADDLTYDEAWIASPQGRPLSLTLPFTPGNRPHRGAVVRAWFDNLLPDSRAIRDRIAVRFHAARTDPFDLLEQIGRDCAGALQILPEGEEPDAATGLQADPLDESAIERLLQANGAAPGVGDEGPELRISLAGAQEKTALLWHSGQWWLARGATPTTHILKLPIGRVGPARIDMTHSVDNEWLCSLLLRAYGLPVALAHPLVFGRQRVLGVERFDRRWSADGSRLLRLPQEDLCQATGTPPHRKYEADGGPGMKQVLQVLDGSTRHAQDREMFFRAQVLFWMLRAPDGHAKNFSIALQAGGGYAMTPLYDVVSFWPVLGDGPSQVSAHRVKLAMAVRAGRPHWKMKEIGRRHWLQVGRALGIVTVGGEGVAAILDDLVARTPRAIAAVQGVLPNGFPQRVADTILSGLETAARELAHDA